jgi:aminoglycoside 3-N-acetyltransferase
VPRIVVVDCLDDCDGIVDWPDNYFGTILRAYLSTGRARQGRVGRARSELLEARDLVDLGVAWMQEHFGKGDRPFE